MIVHGWPDLRYCAGFSGNADGTTTGAGFGVELDLPVLIISSRSAVLGNSALVRAILRLLNRDWSVEVHHIAHASNGIADKLAKQGRELGMESTLFATAPVEVVGLVEVEQRDSSPVTALSSTIAQEVIVDLGGTTFI
ncbi:hypothetical protein V6N13_083133 [Hibiscus sabdariffa]